MKKVFNIKYLFLFMGLFLTHSAFAKSSVRHPDDEAIVDAGNTVAIRQMMAGAAPFDLSVAKSISHKLGLSDDHRTVGRAPGGAQHKGVPAKSIGAPSERVGNENSDSSGYGEAR